MSRKHQIRELAMQVLFLWDTHGQDDQDLARQLVGDATAEASLGPPAIDMAAGAWSQREMIDQRLERIAPHWPPRRQPGVDRSILRLAVWELTNSDTPPKVVLDEAIELAKQFSTEQSPAFINGVLDAVLKEHRRLIEGAEPHRPE
jgi:transcription antitermination protein NusB